ncbi:MAG: Asp-tRNA(Asn)/Glu-tRNA(Gln) amidotransferase subunit GatA [Nannocystaceae bacterium]
METSQIVALTARELAVRVRDGSITARRAADAYLSRVDAVQRAFGPFAHATPDRCRAQADAIDQARARGETLGPLAGVPVGLKNIFVTQGVPTTCGSKILSGWTPQYEGAQAACLRQAGAVLVGKLAMDEFAMGSSNENTPFEPVRNPWARDHVPGGSSGGSAVVVSARAAALSLGSDTGGSIRQPASLCGLVGLKPTYGRVSRFGMIAFASSLDQAGPFARDTRDAALALSVLAGHDPRDATSLNAPVPDYLGACETPIKGLRVGYDPDGLNHEGLDPEVRRAFEVSLRVLRERGAEIVEVALPHAHLGVATYYVLCAAEAASNLARYDGVRYGRRQPQPSLDGMYAATREAGFGEEVKRRILLGTYVLRASSYEEYYGRAMKVRTLIASDYRAAFECCDLLVTPTSPFPSFRIGEKVSDPLAMYLSDIYTVGANLAGLPAISIPGGFSQAATDRPRLPIGFQLLGPRLAEPRLFAAAAAHEADTSWHLERPPGIKA